MGAINGHPHTSHRRKKSRQMHDPPPFLLHFHFFPRITRLEKLIDVWQYIEGDGMRINLGDGRLLVRGRLDLPIQLVDRPRASA